MLNTGIIDSFFLIFAGAAVLASIALYTRQPLLVAYIALGCLIGPHGLQLVSDPHLITEIGEIGIIFLLFLVGLDLPTSKLKIMAGKSLLVAFISSLVFFVAGFALMLAFGFRISEAVITGIAASFSSTILGIKLLPTTVLHHRHIGEIVVSLLLIQDLLAIFALILIPSYGGTLMDTLSNLGIVIVSLPLIGFGAFAGVRFFILPLITKFDAFHEFIFLIALGWCLGIASLASFGGLSFEIGAFVAGISLATSPISQYIAEHLRPLRDFFLVLFFFAVGADLDVGLLMDVFLPALLLSVTLIAIKPGTFALALKRQGESSDISWEVGYRLGQASEFSLMLSYVAVGTALLSVEAAHVIKGATVLTLLISSYLVIFRYPSPIAISTRLRRD